MKKMYHLIAAFLFTAVVFSQGTITGTVVDAENGSPLPGANVTVQGTTNGVAADFDGNFSIEVGQNTGTLIVSYLGYFAKKVTFTKAGSLGTISLQPDAEELEGVVVVGVADFAKDRETPVAVSTIKSAEIIEKLGSQELPEILKSTPSVYATKQGGGFGDARINIRGFNQRNVAVMINGVPVNDMENGWVYWSNWAGLSDVTSAMQVQRGLGSSKLAISSVGGTINILTQTSNKPEGGTVSTSVGNDNYLKTLVSYNTGMLDNGLSASILLSRTTGDGYTDGTAFEGYNYYLALGYNPNDDHALQFTYTGAPQWHNQHSRAVDLRNYIKFGNNGEPDRKYNEQWGYLNGKEYSWRRNFYHKPVMSLNWDWQINDKSSLATVVYASWGRGGGSGPIGRINGGREFFGQFRDENTGLVRFQDIASWNSGGSVPDFGDDRTTTDGKFVNDRSNGFSRRASMNSHDWYGAIINYNHEINENWSFDLGTDLRSYKGIHYRVVNDVLGANEYFDDRDDNNPNRTIKPNQFEEVSPSWNPWVKIKNQEKIEYYNDGLVRWAGLFGQIEYKKDDLSAFMQFGASHQGFKRIEYFNETPGSQETDWENLLGGNIKAGANWNVDENNNFFVNAGYYSKQPAFDAVWINFGNNLNPDLQNEKILGTEIGYGYRSSKFNANVNLYRTSWRDRYESVSVNLDVNNTPDNDDDDERGIVNLNGIEQIHMGIEIDFTYRPSDRLRFNGMVSVGDWQYKGDVIANFVDQDQNVINDVTGNPFQETLYLDKVKVGDAAQMTALLGVDYEVVERLNVDASIYFANNLYANIDATDFNKPDHDGSLKLPSYSLVDTGISYKMLLGKNDDKSLSIRLNINNLLDDLYISESATNRHAKAGDETWNGINTRNRVYFGFGRTWNLGLRYKF